VNKGENLGYPLRPNSDEILLAIHMQAPDGWDGSVTMKYQRRSGQYGFNMDKYMRYAAAVKGEYDDKDFAGNLFEKTLGIKTTVNKTLKKFPIRISASYLFSMTRIQSIMMKHQLLPMKFPALGILGSLVTHYRLG
jgi:hypothetical protein